MDELFRPHYILGLQIGAFLWLLGYVIGKAAKLIKL